MPEPEPILWTLQEAADAIRMSADYLQRSDCPRVFLPSNKPGGREIPRFKPEDVRTWVEQYHSRKRLEHAS